VALRQCIVKTGTSLNYTAIYFWNDSYGRDMICISIFRIFKRISYVIIY